MSDTTTSTDPTFSTVFGNFANLLGNVGSTVATAAAQDYTQKLADNRSLDYTKTMLALKAQNPSTGPNDPADAAANAGQGFLGGFLGTGGGGPNKLILWGVVIIVALIALKILRRK